MKKYITNLNELTFKDFQINIDTGNNSCHVIKRYKNFEYGFIIAYSSEDLYSFGATRSNTSEGSTKHVILGVTDLEVSQLQASKFGLDVTESETEEMLSILEGVLVDREIILN